MSCDHALRSSLQHRPAMHHDLNDYGMAIMPQPCLPYPSCCTAPSRLPPCHALLHATMSWYSLQYMILELGKRHCYRAVVNIRTVTWDTEMLAVNALCSSRCRCARGVKARGPTTHVSSLPPHLWVALQPAACTCRSDDDMPYFLVSPPWG
jgi:hypothetical protein